jgi:hypothetical protein
VLRLRNLVPGRCYEFKVAAFNAVGTAPLSAPSAAAEFSTTV